MITTGPVHPVALLLGVAVGWQWDGLRVLVHSALDPSPATTAMLGSIILLAASIGPWLPERAVRLVAKWLPPQPGGPVRPRDNAVAGFEGLAILRAIRERDRPVLWTAFSVLAALAGVSGLMALGLGPWAIRGYRYLLQHFFWTDLSLAIVEWLGLGLLIGPSWMLNGLVLSALDPVMAARAPRHRGSPGLTGGVLLGLGIALACSRLWREAGVSGPQLYLLGVLPMFALAALAAYLSQRPEHAHPAQARRDAAPPEHVGSGEGRIWLSLSLWGFTAGVLLRACMAVGGEVLGRPPSAGLFMVLMCAGLIAAAVHDRHRCRSPSGCGMALWATGLCAGSAASWIVLRPGHGSVAAGLGLVAISSGYALHYAERAWLGRVGSETLGFAQLVHAVLAAAAIGLIAAEWVAGPLLGPLRELTAGALVLMAFGAIVQIYEPPVARRQYMRVATVLISLVAAMLIFPVVGERWAGIEPAQASRQAAAWDASLESEWAGAGRSRRVCLIGVDPAVVPGPRERQVSFDLLAFDPHAEPSRSRSGVRVVHENALRYLRSEHRPYDVVYQRCAADALRWQSADEWLALLAARTRAGGRIIVDVPVSALTTAAIATIAVTFEHAAGAPATWSLVPAGGDHYLRLRATPGVDKTDLPAGWLSASLLYEKADARLHSWSCDQLSRTFSPPPLRGGPLQWLAASAKGGPDGLSSPSVEVPPSSDR